MKKPYSITITWDASNVQTAAEGLKITLSDHEARQILDKILQDHDADEGITWAVVERAIRELEARRDAQDTPGEEALEALRELCDFLAEAHQEEIDSDHEDDPYADCTYCAAIKNAREILERSNTNG